MFWLGTFIYVFTLNQRQRNLEKDLEALESLVKKDQVAMAVSGPAADYRLRGRFATFTHAVAFVLGFSAVFIALGAAVTAVGQLLYDLRSWLALIGGIVVVIFGLATAGVINIPFLEYDTRYQARAGATWAISRRS